MLYTARARDKPPEARRGFDGDRPNYVNQLNCLSMSLALAPPCSCSRHVNDLSCRGNNFNSGTLSARPSGFGQPRVILQAEPLLENQCFHLWL